jgi:uncharacterized protein YaaQ
MKLLLAIVAFEDAEPMIDALLAQEYRVTRLNTASGWLRRGNVTLLIGAEEAQVDEVISTLRAHCHHRPPADAKPCAAACAVVFVLDVPRFERL